MTSALLELGSESIYSFSFLLRIYVHSILFYSTFHHSSFRVKLRSLISPNKLSLPPPYAVTVIVLLNRLPDCRRLCFRALFFLYLLVVLYLSDLTLYSCTQCIPTCQCLCTTIYLARDSLRRIRGKGVRRLEK